uniref:Putative pheromone receptor n=1 Tax=Flammulina velutipes TaxID=38945 RepID=F1CZK8_FLAVE|nr:putative pheromone receptor [Flammulina velutipes]
MSDITYPLFPIFAFLGFIVCLIPLPWHLQAWNSGTCAFMLWTAATCFVEFVNSIVWHGTVADVAPVWCDIFLLGSNIGIPASVLCISRRLYKITSIQSVSVTRKDKRRDIMIDLAIALGIPLFVLALHTVVHAHRYDILEDIGCYYVTYHTIPTYFLYYGWPIVLGLVSFGYSALTLRSFFIRRAQFTTLLSSTTINMNRYIRLMCLSIADMAFTVPFAIYIVYIQADGVPLSPYISWEDTHYHWNRVEVVPAFLWRGITAYAITVELTRWLAVFCAFTFFGLFGFASEAKKNYAKAFWAIAKLVGHKPEQKNPLFTIPSWNKKSPGQSDSQATLPAYTVSHPAPKRKTSSFSSPDELELGIYSPGPEKGSFNLSPASTSAPPMYTSGSQFDDSASSYQHTCAPSLDVEIASSRFSVGDDEEIDISEPHPSSPFRFEDDFKPLPPLPHGEEGRYTEVWSPYAPPVPNPLRHASSMPLPLRIEQVTRERQGSLTVVVEQTTRVDSR